MEGFFFYQEGGIMVTLEFEVEGKSLRLTSQ